MTANAPLRLDASTDHRPTREARRLESRSYLRLVRLFGARVNQPPVGDPIPTILVPGFISGDVSLGVLARQVRRAGHRTFRSEIGANLGCTDDMVDRLLRRVEQVAELEQRRVALVGHSRGGMVVNLAARRRPDLVGGVVVLSAPVTGTLSVATHVRAQLEFLFRMRKRGWRGFIGEDCVTGECGTGIATELSSPFPADVPYTSVYSRADAIIDWRTCLDPYAEQVEVFCSHTGMTTDPAVWRVVTDRLAAMSVAQVGAAVG